MNSSYSIVSVSTNLLAEEAIAIGMVYEMNETVHFYYSKEKLKLISKLIDPVYKAIVTNLQDLVIQIDKQKQSDKTTFLLPSENLITMDYMHYLARYNNNLIRFSAPKEINLVFNSFNFQKLFRVMVYPNESFETETLIKIENNFKQVQRNVRDSIKPFMKVNCHIDRNAIPELLGKTHLDGFGKNDSFVATHAFDFTKEIATLTKDIIAHLYFFNCMHDLDNKSKKFIVGDAPSPSSKENLALFNALNKNRLVELIPTDETELIVDYCKLHNVNSDF